MTEIKTFTANELKTQSRKVYKEVDKTGLARINHEHYPECIFEITKRDRRSTDSPEHETD